MEVDPLVSISYSDSETGEDWFETPSDSESDSDDSDAPTDRVQVQKSSVTRQEGSSGTQPKSRRSSDSNDASTGDPVELVEEDVEKVIKYVDNEKLVPRNNRLYTDTFGDDQKPSMLTVYLLFSRDGKVTNTDPAIGMKEIIEGILNNLIDRHKETLKGYETETSSFEEEESDDHHHTSKTTTSTQLYRLPSISILKRVSDDGWEERVRKGCGMQLVVNPVERHVDQGQCLEALNKLRKEYPEATMWVSCEMDKYPETPVSRDGMSFKVEKESSRIVRDEQSNNAAYSAVISDINEKEKSDAAGQTISMQVDTRWAERTRVYQDTGGTMRGAADTMLKRNLLGASDKEPAQKQFLLHWRLAAAYPRQAYKDLVFLLMLEKHIRSSRQDRRPWPGLGVDVANLVHRRVPEGRRGGR